MTDDVTSMPTKRRWPWWLRTPHSRLFSEWIELKTDAAPETAKEQNPAA